MAYAKSDQQRIKELLSETIVLLCKNGLHFDSEFSIDALIAITLDQKDIFLVSIKETVQTDNSLMESVQVIGSESGEMKSPTNLSVVGFSQGKQIVTSRHRSDSGPSSLANRKRRYAASGARESWLESSRQTNISVEIENLGKRESCLEIDEESSSREIKDVDCHADLTQQCKTVLDFGEGECRKSRQLYKNYKLEIDQERTSGTGQNTQDKDLSIVKDEPSTSVGSEVLCQPFKPSCQPSCLGNSQAEMLESSMAGSVRNQLSSSSSWIHQGNSNALDGGLRDDVTRHVMMWPSTFPSLLLGTSSTGDVSYCLQPHPNLSPDEMSTATAILTIPGAFINLGCVKAIRQKLRKVPKELLVIVLENMSVMRDSPFFVGTLRCEGISRTFYKCPPSAIQQEALDYYQLDYNIYTDLYNGPIKVPNNIKDPLDWITKTKLLSPFIEQRQS